jgi:hypothetical protein
VAVVVVTISIAIPAMILFHTAAIALPVTGEELSTVAVWCNPAGYFVRRPGPITFVLSVMASNGIPIPLDPCAFRTGSYWVNANRTGVVQF